MADKRWTVHIEGKSHEIVLKQHLMSMTVEVLVDGRTARPPGVRGEAMVAGDYRIEVDNHPVVVHLRPGMVRDRVDLSVDGASLETGQAPAGPDVATSRVRGRRFMSVYIIAAGALVAFALGERYEISGIPARYFGLGLAVLGVLGLFGANVFRSGPLDKRDG